MLSIWRLPKWISKANDNRRPPRRPARRWRRPELLEDRWLLAADFFVDDTLRLDADLDNNGVISQGDIVTFAPGEPGETNNLVFGVNAFLTIQAGVNAQASAPPGQVDTVRVARGSYEEAVNISATVRLIGPQAGVDARTRATGPSDEAIVSGGITVNADNVVINGFTVRDADGVGDTGSGIALLNGTSGSRIRNNIIRNNIIGLTLSNESALNPTRVEGNFFIENNRPGAANGTAIYSDFGAANVLIGNNRFTGHTTAAINFAGATQVQANITIAFNQMVDDNSIVLFGATNVLITANLLSGTNGTGVFIGGGNEDVTVLHNTFVNGTSRPIIVADFFATFGIPGDGTNSNIDILHNSIQFDVSNLTANRSLIDLRGVAGTSDVFANLMVLTGSLQATVTFVNGINIEGAATGNLTVSSNALVGSAVDTDTNGRSAGIRVRGDLGATSDVDLVNNAINGFIDGVRVIGRATLAGNVILANQVAVNVDGGTALLQDNDLRLNVNTGLLIQNGGIVDAGQAGAGTNFTGLGISQGRNNFASYRAGTNEARAIRNQNVDTVAGPQGIPPDVAAERNIFANASLEFIERVVLHDVDNPLLGFVHFTNPIRQNVDIVVVGAGEGAQPRVRVLDAETGTEKFAFLAYNSSFLGGVRVAAGDVNGDGIPDIVTAAGVGGGPHVRVFDGQTGDQLPQPVGSFFAFESSFNGGVFVAVGDVNNDGFADIIAGRGPGGQPEVRVFSGQDGSPLGTFLAYEATFTGGVRVAAGEVNSDARADIVTGPGPGREPLVKVFDGETFLQLTGAIGSFLAFEATFLGGVYVAAGDLNADGRADVIAGKGFGGEPRVRAFNAISAAVLADFLAYEADFEGGVRVAALIDDDQTALIGTVPGPGRPTEVRVFNESGVLVDDFFAFEADFDEAAFLAGSLIELEANALAAVLAEGLEV